MRPERAAVAQLAPQHLHLAQRLLALDDLLEQDLQPLGIDGLGEVVVGADLDGFDGGFDGPLPGQDDRGDVAVLLLQAAHELEAVHARHGEIADDDPGTERGDLAQRFFAVGRRFGDEAPRAHELGQPVTRRRIIFDQQEPLAESRCGGAVDFQFRSAVHFSQIASASAPSRAGMRDSERRTRGSVYPRRRTG